MKFLIVYCHGSRGSPRNDIVFTGLRRKKPARETMGNIAR